MYNKEYYLAHREEILARVKKWREEHPAQYRKALKRCVKRNGLKYKIQQKLYRCKLGLNLLLRQKKYYEDNREKEILRIRKWQTDNLERLRAYRAQKREQHKYKFIAGWVLLYEIQNDRFHWTARKDKFKITDEKEKGFPTLYSAYKNALKYLGDPLFRNRKSK